MKKKIYQRYMLRPLIYMTATRMMTAVIFLLVLVRFVKNGPAPGMISGFLTALFLLFAYLVYLRMDGLKIPRLKHFKTKKKKDVIRMESSMADHMDEDVPVDFDDLEENERDFVSLLSSLINALVFLALSFLI